MKDAKKVIDTSFGLLVGATALIGTAVPAVGVVSSSVGLIHSILKRACVENSDIERTYRVS